MIYNTHFTEEKISGNETVSNLLTSTWLLSARINTFSQVIMKFYRKPLKHFKFYIENIPTKYFCLQVRANSAPTALNNKSY